MKKIPITISLPEDLVRDLHLYVDKRGISKFIAQSAASELAKEKERLAMSYRQANEDEERNKEAEEWDSLNMDGLDERNEY